MAEISALSLVIGGAASGKSAFAEALVTARGTTRLYLASAQAFDDEMRAKIARHKVDRAENGWTTIEEPLNAAAILSQPGPDTLFDCATLWLTNHLLAENDLVVQTDTLITALETTSRNITIVTNEVGQGIVPEAAMSRRFREAQGKLNQRLAATAGLVVQVTAGLPSVLKGKLP